MEFKDSKTMQNLMNSFAGESQARNRYTYFASIAKKAGLEQISAIFLDTADNEKEHAEVFYKHLAENLGSGIAKVEAIYPVILKETSLHLQSAIDGENEEWTKLYPDGARMADEEGFRKIAESFRQVAMVEQEHEKRYQALKNNMDSDMVFKKEVKVKWRCRNCGRVMEGTQAPQTCPTCSHDKAYFELMAENY